MLIRLSVLLIVFALVAFAPGVPAQVRAGLVNLGSMVTGTLPAANGGTGITSLGSGIATWLGTPSSANLASAVTGETGSGALVFGTSPTLTTPVLGVATGTTLFLDFPGLGVSDPTTAHDGFVLENSTAGVNGGVTQQMSPNLSLVGHAWHTADAQDWEHRFVMTLEPATLDYPANVPPGSNVIPAATLRFWAEVVGHDASPRE